MEVKRRAAIVKYCSRPFLLHRTTALVTSGRNLHVRCSNRIPLHGPIIELRREVEAHHPVQGTPSPFVVQDAYSLETQRPIPNISPFPDLPSCTNTTMAGRPQSSMRNALAGIDTKNTSRRFSTSRASTQGAYWASGRLHRIHWRLAQHKAPTRAWRANHRSVCMDMWRRHGPCSGVETD